MNDDFRQFLQAARQLIQSDWMLAGELLGPGVGLPELAAPPEAIMARKAGSSPAAPARTATAPQPGRAPLPPLPPGDKVQQLAAVQAQVNTCRGCGLCSTRTHVVFGEGNPDAQLVFVGEAPGEEEDKTGRPFVGRAGELLTKQILAMGLQRQDVYIANVCKCRPPGNRTPVADEVEHCIGHLMQQLRIIRPKVIVTLGNPATHTLLQTTVGITLLRGQWQELPGGLPELAGVQVMPTFHPAYLLRQYTDDNRKKVWSDLQAVMKRLGLKKPPH